MTAICVVSESSKIASNMVPSPLGGMHLDPLALPFHLCSLLLFVVFYITFGKAGRMKELCINFISVTGMLGGFLAMMIPTDGTDFFSLPAYQCFVYHAGLLWFSIYLLASGKADLSIKSMKTNMLLMIGLVVLALYVNSLLSVYDTNFLFLTRPPVEGLPFLNLDHGWFIYFGHLVSTGLLVIPVFHLTACRLLKKSFL